MSARCCWLVSLAFLTAGCGVKSTTTVGPVTKKPKVAFVTNNSAEFWTIAQAGATKAAAEFDAELMYRRPATGEAAKQKEIVDTLVQQGVQSMAVSVIDPVNQKEYFDKLAEKLNFITQDNDIPGGKRLCYIGTDNYEAGKAVGKLVKEACPNGGQLAIFVGQLEPLNARQRRQGVLDELAGAKDVSTEPGAKVGNFTLAGTYLDQTNEKKARENADDVLTKLSGQDICMVGLWGYNPPTILAAVKARNLVGKVKIIGFDEHDDTLGGIADGSISGTVVQDPFGFGYESVKLLTALAKGDRSGLPKDGIKYVPHRTITKDGGPGRVPVKDFHDELKKLMGKQG